jgi:hypothetical protein
MCSVAENPTSRERLSRPRGVPALLAVSLLLCVVLPAGNRLCGESAPEPTATALRSYDGNFLVTAPDPSTAGWVAKAAELTREKVFELLGYESEWVSPASILLRTRKQQTAEGEATLWTVSVRLGRLGSVQSDLYPNRRDDSLVLQVVRLCLDSMVEAFSSEEDASAGRSVPPWLPSGVAENLSLANLPRLRAFAADIAANETFLPFEDLFRVQIIPLAEAQRELFFRESGSLVDFLLHQPEGGPRLGQAVSALRQHDDFTASLLFVFSREFGTLAQLQEMWLAFAVRQVDRTIGGPRMSLPETRDALQEVLIVNIPVVERDTLEQKVITTDLNGLFRHRNKRLVQRIASEKSSEIFRLSLRSSPQYAPIFQEYLEALTAVARNQRLPFKRHFALAEKLREKLEQSPDFNIEEGENDDTSDE